MALLTSIATLAKNDKYEVWYQSVAYQCLFLFTGRPFITVTCLLWINSISGVTRNTKGILYRILPVLAGKRREKGKQMISPTQQPTTAGNKRHLQHSKYSHKPAKPINYLIPNCTNKKLYEKLWLGSDDLIKPKRRQRLRFLYQCLNNDSSIDIGVMVLILW